MVACHERALRFALVLALLSPKGIAEPARDHAVAPAYGRILRPFAPLQSPRVDDQKGFIGPSPTLAPRSQNERFRDFGLSTTGRRSTLATPLFVGREPERPLTVGTRIPQGPANLSLEIERLLREANEALLLAAGRLRSPAGEEGELDDDALSSTPGLEALRGLFGVGDDGDDFEKLLAKQNGGLEYTSSSDGIEPPSTPEEEGGSSENVPGQAGNVPKHQNVSGGGQGNGGNVQRPIAPPNPPNNPPRPPPPPDLGDNPVVTPPPLMPPGVGPGGGPSGGSRLDWSQVKPNDSPHVKDAKAQLGQVPQPSPSTRRYNYIPAHHNGNLSYQYVAAISQGRGAMCAATDVWEKCGYRIAATASHCIDEPVFNAPDRRQDNSVNAYVATINTRTHYGDEPVLAFVNKAYVNGGTQDTAAMVRRCEKGPGERPIVPASEQPVQYVQGSGQQVWYSKVMPGGPRYGGGPGLQQGRTYLQPGIVGINGYPPGLFETQVESQTVRVQQGDSGGGLFVKAADGAWRLGGVLSTAMPGTPYCQFSSNNSMQFISGLVRYYENAIEELLKNDPRACDNPC